MKGVLTGAFRQMIHPSASEGDEASVRGTHMLEDTGHVLQIVPLPGVIVMVEGVTGIDIPVTGGTLQGVIEAPQGEELLQGTEGGEAGRGVKVHREAQSDTAVAITAAVLYAGIPQLRFLDTMFPLVQRGVGHLHGAGAHTDQDPHWTLSLPDVQAKTGQDHLPEALLERRALFRMVMALLIQAKGEVLLRTEAHGYGSPVCGADAGICSKSVGGG